MRAIRVVSVMESRTVSGPAKNLIRFATIARPEIDLQVLTYARGQDAREPTVFMSALQNAGIEFSLIQEKGRFDFRVLQRLTERIVGLQPDIVQTHAPKSHFLYSLIRKKLPFPWLAFHHGYTAEDLKMRIYNSLNRVSLPQADRVITVCSAFEEQLKRQGVPGEKIRTLHNSIEEDWFEPSKYPARNGEPFTFLCIGRLSNEKGHQYLLQALAELKRLVSTPFRLHLIGTGLLNDSLQAMAASLGLQAECQFLGAHRDVRPAFAAADVFVLPSLSEGSPNVLLEAMAAGTPILASRVGGIPELVGDCAWLIPPADPDSLCRGMLRLIQDDQLRRRLAESARERVRTQFSPHEYASKLTGVYREVLPAMDNRASLQQTEVHQDALFARFR